MAGAGSRAGRSRGHDHRREPSHRGGLESRHHAHPVVACLLAQHLALAVHRGQQVRAGVGHEQLDLAGRGVHAVADGIDERLDEIDTSMKQNRELREMLQIGVKRAREKCEKARTLADFYDCDDEVTKQYNRYLKNI